ncbi:cytochrome c oxidase polypeptide II [Vibrio maritimus]|uniref:Cytochrome c oxidase polypeptide II n=1 Tax=Vibrio maritimus TaxID=990268 RepID=A0A090RN87_9VIBR|nr:cytochrome c oxidase polypeptide II [Vibrio maritimus]
MRSLRLQGRSGDDGPIDAHISKIVDGVSGTAMQSFANQLTDKEIAAVITYQRNAWGNNTGDVIQASDINAYKTQEAEPSSKEL